VARFVDFDTRGYPTVDVKTGYRQWVSSYEHTVEDVIDIALLDQLRTPDWPTARQAADLGCGTGRTGAWLRARGVGAVDGVDLTPEMLAVARSKGAYARLVAADVAATGLNGGRYDLVTAALIDEHLPDLRPLYAEAFRLARPGGLFVLVGMHPQFLMVSGMPTHFTSASGESVAITTHLRLISEQISAGLAHGWVLAEMREGVVDEDWLAVKPKWSEFLGHPVSFALVWRKLVRA
jgi:SAM-dependent methyltransferase